MGGNLRDSGRIVNSQMGSSTIQDTQYNIKHAGIQGYENTRMENEKNRGNRIQDRGDPSQPGGPSKEGPADSRISINIYEIRGNQGFPSISMDVHGNAWRSFDIHLYAWISMDIHGNDIH